MRIILTFLLKNWKSIVSCLALLFALFFVYNYVYQRGVDATTITYEAKLKAQQELLDKRIASLEETSSQLVEQGKTNNAAVKQDLNKILAAAKNKPLVVLKNGECNPSKTFLDSWNQINLRGNGK